MFLFHPKTTEQPIISLTRIQQGIIPLWPKAHKNSSVEQDKAKNYWSAKKNQDWGQEALIHQQLSILWDAQHLNCCSAGCGSLVGLWEQDISTSWHLKWWIQGWEQCPMLNVSEHPFVFANVNAFFPRGKPGKMMVHDDQNFQ